MDNHSKKLIAEFFNRSSLSKGTKKTYLKTYKLVLRHCTVSIDKLTSKDIADFKTKRISKGLKRTTVNKDLMALSSIFNYFIDNDLVKNNPMDPIDRFSLKRSEKIKINYLEHEDVLDLVEEPLRPKLMEPTKIRFRDHVMLMTLYYSGIRPSELAALQWKHVSFKNKTIYIEDSKGHSSRLIEVAEKLIDKLKKFNDKLETPGDNEFIFQSSINDTISTDTINHTVKKYSKRLGLEAKGSSTVVTSYTLRHSYGTRLTERGVSERVIGELMGNPYAVHHYAHVTRTGKRRAANLLDE